MAARATQEWARIYLRWAEDRGWISGFKRKDGRWLIEVPGTRMEAYEVSGDGDYPFVPPSEIHNTIALRNREVYAFIEGCWAGAQVNPVNRAGGYGKV